MLLFILLVRPQGWFHNEGVPFSMNYAQINHVISKIDPAKNVELKIDVPNMEELVIRQLYFVTTLNENAKLVI